jgi:hypothetical protein
MTPLWRRWQSVVAVLLFFLNVDFVLMPWATAWGMSAGWPLFWMATLFATGEPCYWNWYAKWLVRNVRRSARLCRAAGTFRDQGVLVQLKDFGQGAWDWFVEHSLEHAGVDTPTKQRMLQSAISLVRGTHVVMTYPLMLGLGLVPSGWPFAIFVQRILPVPGAFVVFLAANALKTYALGLVYLWLPWWGKILVLLGAAIFLSLSIRKVVHKVKGIKPDPSITESLP